VEAERRQVTVLFANMVGFTAFSERSGEEAAFTLMQSLAKLMEDAVRELGVLSATRKKRDEARSYFEKARVGAERRDADKLLQKIDVAFAEFQQGL
jgi:class 3 adenylate cyclase